MNHSIPVINQSFNCISSDLSIHLNCNYKIKAIKFYIFLIHITQIPINLSLITNASHLPNELSKYKTLFHSVSIRQFGVD